MKKFGILSVCTMVLLSSCGKNDLENSSADTTWFTGGLIFRSHEDINRFAISFANTKIGWELFPIVQDGDSGATSTNPVVLGNHHTDFPEGRISEYYAARGYDVNDKNNGALHFTRSFVDGKPLSLVQACEDSKKKILQITNLALASWHVQDASSFFFWAGHVSHTIQDSFAPAHVHRTGDDLRTIADICTFGTEVPGICYHGKVESSDSAWSSTSGGTYDPTMRPFWAMKKEAQTAALATAGYFYMLNRAIVAHTYDATALLNEYFTSSAAFNGGYFVCK